MKRALSSPDETEPERTRTQPLSALEALPFELQQEIVRNLSPASVASLAMTSRRMAEASVLAAPTPLQQNTAELRRDTNAYIDQWFYTGLLPSSQRTAFIDALGRLSQFRRATTPLERNTLVYQLATVWPDVLSNYWQAPTLDATMERAWQRDDNQARARRMILSVQQANRGQALGLYPFRVDLAGRSRPTVADLQEGRPFRLWILADHDLYEGMVSADQRTLGPTDEDWVRETDTFLRNINPVSGDYTVSEVDPDRDLPPFVQPRRLTDAERTAWVVQALVGEDLVGIVMGDNVIAGQARLVDPVLTVYNLGRAVANQHVRGGEPAVLDATSDASKEPFENTQHFAFDNAINQAYYWFPYENFLDQLDDNYLALDPGAQGESAIPRPSLAHGIGWLFLMTLARTYPTRQLILQQALSLIREAMFAVGFPA